MALNPIAKKEYYSIGEVCEITGLKPHVLRYWETQFKGLAPVKNRAGNRAYRKREIEMVQLVKELLYDKKYTIEGARQRLAEMASRIPSRRWLAISGSSWITLMRSIVAMPSRAKATASKGGAP
jgi:DNA-binding transcriptional MerR regulator